MMVAGIKAYIASPTDAKRRQCLLFAKPLVASLEAVVAFIQSDNFRGMIITGSRNNVANSCQGHRRFWRRAWPSLSMPSTPLHWRV